MCSAPSAIEESDSEKEDEGVEAIIDFKYNASTRQGRGVLILPC